MQTGRGHLDFQFLAQDFQIEEGGSQDFLIQNVSGSTDIIKRHTSNVKNSQPGHGFPISVKHRVILPYCESFIFMKLPENKTLTKVSKFTVCQYDLVERKLKLHQIRSNSYRRTMTIRL